MTFSLWRKRKTLSSDSYDRKRKTPSADGKRSQADEELLELFRNEWEQIRQEWPLLSALKLCCSWGQSIPAWLEKALTDPKQAYRIGFRDGYEQAKKTLRDETYRAVTRIEAKTSELAELVRMSAPDGAADNEPDPPTRPN